MKLTFGLICTAALTAGLPSVARAAVLYSEAFDSSAANVKIISDSDTPPAYVDYSNFTVGSTNFSIPEAPRMVGGSAATRGILLRANVTSGATQAINVLAGATPIVFSGDYRLSFDAYMNVPIPLPSGSTEQLIWGIGSGGMNQNSRHTRSVGTSTGIWGWLAGDNDYGSEDVSFNNGGVNIGAQGDGPEWNTMFSTTLPGRTNKAPANSWVAVDISRFSDKTVVKFNGVTFAALQNFPLPPAAAGAALFGYEDPFSGISNAPDGMWGLFDNFVVQSIPEPSTGALALLTVIGLEVSARRRTSSPSV